MFLAGEHFMLRREADLQSKFRRQNHDIKYFAHRAYSNKKKLKKNIF